MQALSKPQTLFEWIACYMFQDSVGLTLVYSSLGLSCDNNRVSGIAPWSLKNYTLEPEVWTYMFAFKLFEYYYPLTNFHNK